MTVSGDVSWRTRNLGALLFAARDRCIADKLGALAARGHQGVTDAQLVVFHHLDAKGSRLTDLAGRAGLTKSTIAEFVKRAVGLGLIEQRPESEDRRAKRLIATAKGRAFAQGLKRAIANGETLFTAVGGSKGAGEARVLLSQWSCASPDDAIGRLFAAAARGFAADVRTRVSFSAPPVGEPLLTLFRLLDLEGSRLTDLARRARISKPAMRETVESALQRGLISRVPDPQDGRACRLSFTTAGLALLDCFRDAVAATESARRDQAGDAALTRLRATLTTYIDAGPAARSS